MRTLFVVLLATVALSGCEKKPSAPAEAQPPPSKPKIEDVAVDDLGTFLGGTEWCRSDASGDQRYAFTVDGKWTQRRTGGAEPAGQGTWRVESGRVVLEGADGGTRNLDVQAGKVNDKPVVAFDGRLFGSCE